MSVSISDFWRLLGESRLLSPQHVQQLAAQFAEAKHAAEPTAKTLAQWLISRNVLSRYQAIILLGGRAGPFQYGDYKVYDRIEQGRLAGSFRAVHAASGHRVLLKFFSGSLTSDARAWAAASGNVWAACDIRSPYVQRCFELVDLPTFKFTVNEDVRGSGLDQSLGKSRIPPAEACRIARLAALGLVQVHGGGRAHGDMRPASVVLEAVANQPPNAKLLLDAHESAGPIDFANEQAGSRFTAMADYLAPELAQSGKACDALSDVYALGCTLYAMLAGQPPFAGGSLQQKMSRHATEPIKPLESLGVPQAIGQLTAYMMAKNPAVRYQSAAIVAEQLAAHLEPASLRLAPPAPAGSLAAYEAYLQQKHAAAAASEPSPFAIQTERDRVAAAASRAAAVTVRAAAPVASSAAAAAPIAAAAVGAAPAIAIQAVTKGRGGRSADQILRERRAQRRRNLIAGLVGTTALAIAVLVAGGIWWGRGGLMSRTVASAGEANAAAAGGNATLTPTSAGENPASDSTTAQRLAEGSGSTAAKGKTADGGPAQQVASDDGKLLWASPTNGKPVTFRCVPPEGQVFLIARPAAMLASPDGQRVLAALGPEFAAPRQAWEAASGFNLEEVEQLHITLHNNDAKFPRASFVVKTKEAVTLEQLLARWGNPTVAKENAETYYTGASWAYYVPHSPEDERTFAMGEARDIKDVAAAAGAPPAVFREIERLRRVTDGERHFTLLFYPQFLFNDDGQPLFTGERAKVREPLAWLLGDNLQAASVSANFGDEFYLEARMLASLDREPYQLAEELRQRLDKVPAGLEDYFVSLNPPPYWKKLAFRYPGMVRELISHLRIGVENEQAIANSVLPAAAAHNLVLGGELVVATTPGPAAAGGGTAVAASAGPKTIADALQWKTSYSFDNQPLEFAMRDLADDVKGNLKNAPFEFAIKIIGGDLEKDGITRNQSVRDFKQESQTVADILTALVRKANPVTTVKEPSEKDQKLVWVIGPDPDNPSKQAVLITTRTAAAAKKYTLPAVFVTKK